MDKQDLIFTGAFVISLTFMIYFLGTSITGFFALTMHCEGGICKEICRSNTDCDAGEICCDKGNFGVCEARAACEKEYELQPELDVDIGEIPLPSPTEKTNLIFYSILTLLIIIIGAAYFSKRKKYIQEEQHL